MSVFLNSFTDDLIYKTRKSRNREFVTLTTTTKTLKLIAASLIM